LGGEKQKPKKPFQSHGQIERGILNIMI